MTNPGFDRRQVLTRAAGLGLGLPVLAACGGGSETDGPTAAPGTTIASTSEVEVGGGRVLTDQKLVVTQPTDGEFRAFTAVCTHAGCLVDAVSDGKIMCPCHGSAFSVADGSVVDGPATAPLEQIEITVEGDEINAV